MINLISSSSWLIAADGATKIMQDAVNVNQDAIESWNEKWANLFDDQLFSIIVYMSTYLGVVAIVLWMVHEIKDFDGDKFLFKRSFYTNLMWALFVMAMLVPNGDRLEALAQGMHSFGQQFNQMALEFQLNDIALEDAIRATVGRGTLEAEISAQQAQCQGFIGERQFACMSDAHQQVKDILRAYEEEYLVQVPPFFRELEKGLEISLAPENGSRIIDPAYSAERRIGQGAIEGWQENDGLVASVGGGIRGAVLGALGGALQSIVQMILFAVQWGFVNLLELAMLMTALVSPFALVLSFMPGRGARPILAWVIGYASMVMVQFYYNVMIGLMANVVLNSNAHDVNGFLIVMAIFGPVLAMKLAQGGGVSVFDTLASGAGQLTSTAIGTGLKAAAGGGK